MADVDRMDVSDAAQAPEVEMEDDPNVKRKGRGIGARETGSGADGVEGGQFEAVDSVAAGKDGRREARSIEGWIVVVTNVHEEATEEELQDKFADFGEIKNVHLNLDRRTGFVKGYALIEYETNDEARAAIEACSDGLTLLEQPLKADFAFKESTLHLVLRLRGGAKKRKKKTYTTPKKIKHKRKKVKMALLKYYKVQDSGEIKRLRRECPAPTCGAGVFMAWHTNRQYCGKCHLTYIFEPGTAPPKA
ncbi:unnamed protein product [Tilletia caries]|nr:unnamed protein product [Tilletia caries]